MLVIRLIAALALVVLPALAWAQPIVVGCSRPVISPDALINVVVLPYSQPESFGRSPIGEELAELVRLETMLTLAKLGGVATVHLFHDVRGACAPDVVYDRLIRGGPNQRPLGSGRGLILIWGRFFQSGSDLYIQTFIRFERRQLPESVAVTVRDQRLTGRLSSQVFACAPRKIEVNDFKSVEQQLAAASVLRLGPSPTAPPAPQPPVPMRLLVTSTKGDWMQVQFVPPVGPRTPTQYRGWFQVRSAEWSLGRRMPELYFVEGIAQFLAARVPGNRLPSDATLASADAAIARYLEAWGEKAVLSSDAAAGGTPLAVAVPRQVRAFISLLRRRASDEAPLADARAQFERAAALVPQSSDARNLVAITKVAQTYLKPSADQPPRPFIDDVGSILGSDPGNRTLLDNLRAIYELVLAPVVNGPASWGLSAADRDQLVKQRESLKSIKPS